MSNTKLDPNQLARQRKKIEKDRRRKQYDDLQVQGTNNSSIVSKRSVEMLYTKKLNPEVGEWFKYFVKKPKRRSPAINRGYWIRMESIKEMILRIINLNPKKEVSVINLGCGFDPLPFQLLSSFKDKKDLQMKFLDIDYPELVQNKLKMIGDSLAILKILGEEINNESYKKMDILFATNNYKLIGCDLKDDKTYNRQLIELLGDNDGIKIFVAEVSLAYMKPEFADPIIRHSSNLSNSHFLILEQILPSGKYNSFAQKMLYHFNHLRSPLQCVETYPLKSDQIKRFKQFYPNVEIKDLYENWDYLVDNELKCKIDEIEEFDEWEEFIIFCQHYVIVHATNMPQLIYEDIGPQQQDNQELDESIKISYEEIHNEEMLHLKFPAVTSLDDKIIINGGLKQTRTDSTLSLDNNTLKIMEPQGDIPSPRMCHTLTAINNEVILIGGRSKPNNYFQDIYKLSNNRWVKLGNLPNKRSRHASIKLSDEEVLIFGGSEDNNSNDLFLIYNIQTETYKVLTVAGEIPNLLSCSMAFNGEFGLIIGGMVNKQIPIVNDKLYKFTIKQHSIHIEILHQHSMLTRIGCQCKFINNNKILIIGGISPLTIFHQSNNIVTFDIPSKSFKNVHIPNDIWIKKSPIFIGFGVAEIGDNKLKLVAGGAVCYSFGSYYNASYTIEYGS